MHRRIDRFRRAHFSGQKLAIKKASTQGKKSRADEAARSGRLDEAYALFKSVCALDPGDAEAWVKLALVEKRRDHYKESETYARRAIALQPRLGFCHYALGVALHGQGLVPEAIASYRKAIALQPDFADFHYLLGSALHGSGELAEAISCYRQAVGLRPDFPAALGDLAAALIDTGDVEQGLHLLRRVLQLEPGNAIAWTNMANAFRLQGKDAEALETYRHARLLAPDSLPVAAGLADLLEKTGELAEAAKIVSAGLAVAPRDARLSLVGALLARREKRLDAAATLLESARNQSLSPDLAGDIDLLLGQVYDQMNLAERAFPLFVSGKRSKAKASLLEIDAGRSFRKRVARMVELATPELVASVQMQQQPELQGSFPDPVFLIGFPRSGTTLLEQILDSHPSIQTMEEKGAVSAMEKAFWGQGGQGVASLATLDGKAVLQLRKAYFDEVSHHIELRAGQVFVDKLPLNLVSVPLIWKVFPRAKFILALRHPCDVCLSCFMQNFAANDAMANFFSLEDAAGTYEIVMKAWERYVSTLPLIYHRVRYEDLVEDVEGECRRLIEFLSVPWNDDVLKHSEKASAKRTINTPSYHQVVQPIYCDAKYRWQRYEKELAPLVERLRPFITSFGYGSSIEGGGGRLA